MKVSRKVFDAHCHIGTMKAYPFYGLPEPIKPSVYDFVDKKAQLKNMDKFGIERALVMSNYGIPEPAQPFGLNEVVLDACNKEDRILGAIWFSGASRDKDLTAKALKLAGSPGIKVLKTTCLLGGTYNPEEWDEETKKLWESVVKVAEKHNYIFHLHTSPGGGSDVSNAIKFVRMFGKRVKIHVVHMGGGVSGHIKFVPEFFNLIREGYQIYTDSTWAVGFAPRLLLDEIEKQGIGDDRFMFGSDEPWSDFWGEYYKIEGADISEELKNKIFWENAMNLYGG